MNRRPVVLAAPFLGLLFAACGTTRGLPSHGGGKRFSEEQRAVAGAIRQAVATMDLAECRRRRVRIQVTAMPGSGAGNITYGGLRGVSVNGGLSDYFLEKLRSEVFQPRPPDFQSQWREETWHDSRRAGANLNYDPNSRFYIQRQNTEGDVAYLRASLDMKARHEGIVLAAKNADVVLHVLVDVLGTNRSRGDFLFWRDDELTATCELTYYAQDLKAGSLLFACRRSAADGSYGELALNYLPLPSVVDRRLVSIEPSRLPVCTDDLGGDGGDWQPVAATADPDEMLRLEEEARRRSYLETLTQQARAWIGEGRLDEAHELLGRIRAIDADHEELPGLEEDLREEAGSGSEGN